MIILVEMCWRVGKKKAGQMAEAFVVGLLRDTPSGFARAKSAPIPYDQLSGFHLGLVVVMALIVGRRGLEHLLVAKANSLHCRSPWKRLYYLSSKSSGNKGLLSKQPNAISMWEDGKRLFVRGVISRCSAFDVRGFNQSSKFVHCASIVFAIVRPLRAAQSLFLAVLNRESHLQKAMWKCVCWIF